MILRRSYPIEFDPLNPAQFLACCGMFELLASMNPDVLACFKRDSSHARRVCFQLYGVDAAGLSDTISSLKKANATAIDDFSGGEAPVKLDIPGMFPFTLDWWLLPERNKKSKFKLWAGNQKTLDLVKDMLYAEWGSLDNGLLEYRYPMSGRFGLDPRSAWNTLDFGSSPNTQSRDVYSYPAAEMLAAVGLQGFRPRSSGGRGFSYWLWTQPLPLVAARAAVSGALPDVDSRAFAFQVDKRSGSYSYFTFSQPIKEESHE